jgi:hypothetical protein
MSPLDHACAGANVMFVVLPGLVYILASWIAFKATDDTSWLVYCSVGYSGATLHC